jgi:hypothetical protein
MVRRRLVLVSNQLGYRTDFVGTRHALAAVGVPHATVGLGRVHSLADVGKAEIDARRVTLLWSCSFGTVGTCLTLNVGGAARLAIGTEAGTKAAASIIWIRRARLADTIWNTLA